MNSRRDAARAFVRGDAYRSGAAIFTDGSRIWSYGPHYVIAEYITDPADGKIAYIVNEENYSPTTNQHRGAVKDALKQGGWKPTTRVHTGENGHTYRVWR